jgi:hypothetical protein
VLAQTLCSARAQTTRMAIVVVQVSFVLAVMYQKVMYCWVPPASQRMHEALMNMLTLLGKATARATRTFAPTR